MCMCGLCAYGNCCPNPAALLRGRTCKKTLMLVATASSGVA